MKHTFSINEYLTILNNLSITSIHTFIQINKYCKECSERITTLSIPKNLFTSSLKEFPALTSIHCKANDIPLRITFPESISLSVIFEHLSNRDVAHDHSNRLTSLELRDTDTFLPFPPMKNLQKLSFKLTKRASQAFRDIIDCIPNVKQLTFLSFPSDQYDLIPLLSRLNHLERVQVDTMETGKKTLKLFMEEIGKLSHIKFIIGIAMNMLLSQDYSQIDSVLECEKNITIRFSNVDLRERSKRDVWNYITDRICFNMFKFILSFAPTKFPNFSQEWLDKYITYYLPDFPHMTIQKQITNSIDALELYDSVEFTKSPKNVDLVKNIKSIIVNPIFAVKEKHDTLNMELYVPHRLEKMDIRCCDFNSFTLGAPLRELTLLKCSMFPKFNFSSATSLKSLVMEDIKLDELILPYQLEKYTSIACQIDSINLNHLRELKELQFKYYQCEIQLPASLETVAVENLNYFKYNPMPTYLDEKEHLKTLTMKKIMYYDVSKLPNTIESIELNDLEKCETVEFLSTMTNLKTVSIEKCFNLHQLVIPSTVETLKLRSVPITTVTTISNKDKENKEKEENNEKQNQINLKTLSIIGLQNMFSFEQFTQLTELSLTECQSDESTLISFPQSIEKLQITNSLIPRIQWDEMINLKEFIGNSCYSNSFKLPNSLQSLRLSFMESFRGECMSFNHLTSLKSLNLMNVNGNVFDISQCHSLEIVELKSVVCRSFEFPQNIQKIVLTNIHIDGELNVQSLNKLTSLDLIISSFKSINYPSSLVELLLRQCNEYVFDPKVLNNLPNLRRFVSRDIKFESPLYEENYPLINFSI